MAKTNFKPPSEKTIKFLYNGVIAFYPDVARGVFGLGKTSLPYHESWGGFKRLEFLEFALNTTGTESVDEAAATIRAWREGRSPERTVPDKLDEMVAALEEEEEKAQAGGRTKATFDKQKLAKDTLLESQRAKEALEAVEVPAAPAPEAETPVAGIQITPQPGQLLQKFTNRVASLPIRTAISWSAPRVAVETPGPASAALTLWARGITGAKLEEKANLLEAKEAKRFTDLVKAIKGLETGYSLQTRIIRNSFPVKDITILLGPETGVTQAQVAIFFTSPEQGAVSAIPHHSFFGNLISGAGRQLFGKVANRAVKGFVSRAVAGVAGKAGGAAVGAEIGAVAGGPLAPFTAIIGAIVGWITSKIPDAISWLKTHAKDFGIAALALLAGGAFLGSPLLVASGLGLGALSLGAGGIGALASGAAGFGSGVLGAITGIALPAIGVPILVSLLSLPVLVAIILFIINSGAYLVPPAPFSEAPFGVNITCTQEKDPIAFANSTASPIARRAWQITSDLYQGFWCFWNRSPGDYPKDVASFPPSYPELFNEGLFERNPNPSREEISNCGSCMFWCTYLIQRAYREAGNSSLLATLWAPTMQEDFARRGKFISGANASSDKVVSGSVVFFRVQSGPPRTNHVGLVHSVNRDGIVYLQSNAPTKSGSLTFNKGGKGIQNLPGIVVVGIGLP